MIIENEMIHGCLPRSGGSRQQPQFRSVRSAQRPHEPPRPLPRPEHQRWGDWDTSAQFYKETQMRCEEAGETYRPPWRTRIGDDTPIIPRGVAERVCEEACLWLGEPFPRAWVAELAERASVVYQHNAGFRRLLRRRGNAGRDWLWAFMRHWLCALLASRRPDLYRRLPAPYAVGRDLPPPPRTPNWTPSSMTSTA